MQLETRICFFSNLIIKLFLFFTVNFIIRLKGLIFFEFRGGVIEGGGLIYLWHRVL